MRPGKRLVEGIRLVCVDRVEVLGLGVLCLAVSAFYNDRDRDEVTQLQEISRMSI